MEPRYIFRHADPGELNQIKDLTLLAFMQFGHIISKENAGAWQENLSTITTYTDLFKTASCFVCVHENKIIGSAFLIPRGNPYKWFQADWAYIRLVAVHPDFEGKGIGKKLTQHCMDAAKIADEKTIALHTSEFQHAARHIYERMGFVKLKDLDRMYGKQYYLYTFKLD